ncbi:hypothetical protein V5G24_14005 [Xanthobacter sp. VTT E-85241]|uniref:hypothetical protein n=1 Tax=Roseixanthobacter finlandensis TaxID=3119922 RepID=UPI002D0063D5|nr:hypothetical protein [Xanthobacteraceae bacterium]
MRADEERWGASHQQRPIELASERTRIEPAITSHVLRHAHASQFTMNGVSMRVIADQLGRHTHQKSRSEASKAGRRRTLPQFLLRCPESLGLCSLSTRHLLSYDF